MFGNEKQEEHILYCRHLPICWTLTLCVRSRLPGDFPAIYPGIPDRYPAAHEPLPFIANIPQKKDHGNQSQDHCGHFLFWFRNHG